MTSRYVVALSALALLLSDAAAAGGIGGDAQDYNVFIFGDGSFSSQNSDTMGNLAVGGNVSLTNYSVASGIVGDTAQSSNPARLVAGGTLTAQNGGVGSNQNGAIYTNGAASLTSFTARGGVHAQTVINSFAADATEYSDLSASLFGLAANGRVSSSYGTLTLTGASTGLNVFDISASDLSNSNSMYILAPAGSTVLVNVSGTSATFQNGQVFETGIGAASVLYNFNQATSVSLAGSKNPMGSILAPLSGVTGGYGAMDGQLIAASFVGNTEFHSVQFTGDIAAIPEPASAWLMLSGLGLVAAFARWSRQSGLRPAA